MKGTKTIKKMTYNGFGFPIVLQNVPAKRIRGKTQPLINYKILGHATVAALCLKQTPLTGNQVRFLRQFFELSLREFASTLGLSHQALMKWEEYKDRPAHISATTEKSIRLDAIFRLGIRPNEFHKAFSDLQSLAKNLASSEGQKELPMKIAI